MASKTLFITLLILLALVAEFYAQYACTWYGCYPMWFGKREANPEQLVQSPPAV
ncbi:hypothetical protein GCK32_020941 [Trichostrongylus colubriformis]|uniref:Uncharacterized protein n=1 Tax=Trichostrongylus colubriformis TaxID=6319 RepID=A0AAN8ET47_TRICO